MIFDLEKIPLHGVHLIEASAGTGKTYSIEGLYIRLIESGLRPDQILVVTFTEAATSELRDRIRTRLRKNQSMREKEGDSGKAGLLRSAVLAFDTAAIFTIHGFCYRMLNEMAFETGSAYALELITDQTDIAMDTVWDFFRKYIYNLPQEYLARAKLSPDDFLKTARMAGPGTRIIPEVARPGIESGIVSAKTAYSDIQATWKQSRHQVCGILETSSLLNRKSYQRKTVANAIEEMDGFVEDGFTTVLFDRFKYFRHSFMAEMSNRAGIHIDRPLHPFFEHCDGFAEIFTRLNNAFNAMTIWLKRKFTDFYMSNMPLKKESLGSLHFDDLLLKMRQALASGGEGMKNAVREKFKAALIDEFQDTDPVQWEIFSTIFSDGTMYLIGDPKQSIYGFRGADIFTYLDAKKGIPEKNIHRLDTNRRSVSPLVEAVNRLFAKGPFGHAGIPYERVEPSGKEPQTGLTGEPLRIWTLGDPSAEMNKDDAARQAAEAVAAEAARLINIEHLRPGHIAVLSRKWRQADLVRDALVRRGIKCIITSDEKVFSSPEALLMRLLLDAAREPSRFDLIKACLASPLFGMSADELATLDEDSVARDVLITGFLQYHELWRDYGFMRMFREFYGGGARERLAALPGAERRLTNMQHLAELLHLAETSGKTGMDSLIVWLNEKTGGNTGSGESELRLESDEDAVIITTVHKSKGLQYPVVFIPFAWDETDTKDVVFNDSGTRVLDLGSEDMALNRQKSTEESLQESMRLLYVALTRATDRCYLMNCNIHRSYNTALETLLLGEDASSLNSDYIRLEPAPQTDVIKSVPPEKAAPELAARQFEAGIDMSFGIMSYTSLSKGVYSEGRDVDASTNRRGDQPAGLGIPSMPKGAATGNMLHEVMELIDFKNPDADLIKEVMKRHGFDEKWLDAVNLIIQNVLSVEVEPGSRLECIGMDKKLSELEFMLPVTSLDSQHLNPVLKRSYMDTDLKSILEALDIKPSRGFLRGFIDLVFELNGKFYIVDWKSNYLGPEPEDYGDEALKNEMTAEYYVLQYHIYTLALHRYLMLRLPGYSYERHFGGVLYIFLRGVNNKKQTGIYRARPDEKTVGALAAGLLGEMDNV